MTVLSPASDTRLHRAEQFRPASVLTKRKESYGHEYGTSHGTRPPTAGHRQRSGRLRQRAAHRPRTGATAHGQTRHRGMAARREPRRRRDHQTEDTIGNQSMQPIHGATREHRGPRKPVQSFLQMPQGRKRTRRDQRHHNLRNPRRRRQDRSHLDRHGNQPRRHVARKSAHHTPRESQRGLEERLLPRIPGRDRPQIPDPPTRDGIRRHRQGTRHRAQRPGRPMD